MKRIAYLFLTLFLFIPSVVKADTFSQDFPSSSFLVSQGTPTYNLVLNSIAAVHTGNGYASFSFMQVTNGSYSGAIISEITVGLSDNSVYNCTLTTNLISHEEDSANNFYYTSVYCPLDLTNKGISKFYFTRTDSSVSLAVYLGYRFSFTNDFDYKILEAINNSNYTDVLNSIYSKLDYGFHDIYQLMLQNQNDMVTTMTEQIQQQQQTNEKLNETNKELGELNDNITDSSITDASSSADSFLVVLKVTIMDFLVLLLLH